jgi:lysophospholipase L1-like esterase
MKRGVILPRLCRWDKLNRLFRVDFQGESVKIGIAVALLTALAGSTQPIRAQATDAPPATNRIAADDSRLLLLGQIDSRDPKRPRLGYPGTGIILRFQGASLTLDLSSDSEKSALTIVVDHGAPALQLLQKGEQSILVASGLDTSPHTAEIYKRTETWQGVLTLLGIELPADGKLLAPPPLPARKLLFVGDSVTCGAGVENNSTCTGDPAHPANDVYDSYGMELGRRLDAQTHLVCYGGRGVDRDYRGLGIADNILNAPQFLDLSIASDEPSGRAPWKFSQWTPDAVFVSLGTNDFNLQKTKPLDGDAFVEDYARLLMTLRSHYPRAAIFATEGAIVTDPLLRKYVQDAVQRTHDARIQWVEATHYPGNGCDGHPTRAQHLHMADDIEPVLRKALSW